MKRVYGQKNTRVADSKVQMPLRCWMCVFPVPSFGTVQRTHSQSGLSHVTQILNPNLPVIPFGISRCFRAVACIHTGASPTKDSCLVSDNLSLSVKLVNILVPKKIGVKLVAPLYVPGQPVAKKLHDIDRHHALPRCHISPQLLDTGE